MKRPVCPSQLRDTRSVTPPAACLPQSATRDDASPALIALYSPTSLPRCIALFALRLPPLMSTPASYACSRLLCLRDHLLRAAANASYAGSTWMSRHGCAELGGGGRRGTELGGPVRVAGLPPRLRHTGPPVASLLRHTGPRCNDPAGRRAMQARGGVSTRNSGHRVCTAFGLRNIDSGHADIDSGHRVCTAVPQQPLTGMCASQPVARL